MTIETIPSPLSWDAFKEEIQNLPQTTDRKGLPNKWIFRGHENTSYKLESRLERYLKNETGAFPHEYKHEDYIKTLNNIIQPLNQKLNKSFKQLSYQDILACDIGLHNYYELINYLRHYGFPTPTLDWTKNSKIAAYFAYAKADFNQDVAIYAYNDFTLVHAIFSGCPHVDIFDPLIQGTQRHINQQSIYTICLKEAQNSDDIVFSIHEDGLTENKDNHEIRKYILDGKEKDNVLNELYDEGITSEFLFPETNEAILEDLARYNLLKKKIKS